MERIYAGKYYAPVMCTRPVNKQFLLEHITYYIQKKTVKFRDQLVFLYYTTLSVLYTLSLLTEALVCVIV